jgi:hypothetical protein
LVATINNVAVTLDGQPVHEAVADKGRFIHTPTRDMPGLAAQQRSNSKVFLLVLHDETSQGLFRIQWRG